MTTNARDEKWSEWIDWSGGECPVSEGSEVSVKYRDGDINNGVKAGITGDSSGDHHFRCAESWGHNGTPSDIIAYRYKIKEPESDGARCKFCNGEGKDRDGYDMLTGASCRQCSGSGLDQSFMTESEEELTAEEWAVSVPEGAEAEGRKYDTDKPAMDLIPPYMEEEVGMVLAFGAHKYAPDNWRKVSPLRSRYLAAAQRHINALKKGEQMDPESGLHHAAHAVCCLMFLGEVELETRK